MAMNDVKAVRLRKAKEQVATIENELISHAGNGTEFQYEYKGRLYPAVRRYFVNEGWNIKEKFISLGDEYSYIAIFTIPENADITMEDLRR